MLVLIIRTVYVVHIVMSKKQNELTPSENTSDARLNASPILARGSYDHVAQGIEGKSLDAAWSRFRQRGFNMGEFLKAAKEDGVEVRSDSEMLPEDFEPHHAMGCCCADCSGAELTADND